VEYIKIAQVADFQPGTRKSFRILAKHVALFRHEDGRFHAIESGCKHAHADLMQGRMEGSVATCPRHQWMYDMHTGECLRGNGVALRRHAVRIEEGNILIGITPQHEWELEDNEEDEFDLNDEVCQEG
jgi:nitrite reductase/ring-hydroxylating ferredoxin subunit